MMKKLMLASLALALCSQHLHAMDEDIALALLSMEGSETAGQQTQQKKYAKAKKATPKDCACVAKACCFACALCGLVTAPAMARPVRAEQPWRRLTSESIRARVTVEQTYNGMSSTETAWVELPCFVTTHLNVFHCSYSLVDAYKFYQDNNGHLTRSDRRQDQDSGSGQADPINVKQD